MKKYFITGLLIWVPLVITVWVLKLVVDMLVAPAAHALADQSGYIAAVLGGA